MHPSESDVWRLIGSFIPITCTSAHFPQSAGRTSSAGALRERPYCSDGVQREGVPIRGQKEPQPETEQRGNPIGQETSRKPEMLNPLGLFRRPGTLISRKLTTDRL